MPKASANESLFLPSRLPGDAVPAPYAELPVYTGPETPDTGSVGLLDYWRILKRRKGSIVLIASLGALAGFLATLPQTPVYQAMASVEIMGLNQDFLNVRSASPVTESSNTYDTVDIPTYVRILQSDSILDRVTERISSESTETPLGGGGTAWRRILNLPDPAPVDARTLAVNQARRTVKGRPAGQTRIIEITADSTDPEIAAKFVNSLSEEFIQQTLDARFSITEKTGQFLSRQIDDMRVRLEQSEDRLQRYATQVGLVFTAENNNVSSEKLSQVQESLSAAQADRILKQARWESAIQSTPEALPDIVNDSTLREYQAKLTELNRQLAELRQTYTEESAQVRKVLAQVGPVAEALSREKNDILSRIRTDYEEAQRREKLLEADYASQRSIITGEGEKAIQYNILKREVDSNRQLYDAMLQQMKQASLATALRASNIRVIDHAKVPDRPYTPNAPRSAGIGMLSGLLLAVGLVIVRERADRAILDPGETPMYINLPELGVVPQDRSRSKVRIRLQGGAGRLTAAMLDPLQPELSTQRTELATLQRGPSRVAESFRSTLVSLLFGGATNTRPRTVVITSASPSEGKSTVVSNLGIAAAEVNQKVLLIDADLRRPRLHEIFNLSNERGLVDMLMAKEPHADLPEGVIQETAIPGLFVMCAGAPTSSATSILYSNRMPDLLRRLRTEFETIFVDTPPMLQIPDARVLGRMADRVVLVVRAGRTTRDAICAAHHRFFTDGTPVMGTVLNDWNPKHTATGYYQYYNSYYSKQGYYAVDKAS